MVTLANLQQRWEIDCAVIEGGAGFVRGVITETDQIPGPSYLMTTPKQVFRTSLVTALKPGMVIQTPSAAIYIVGANGPSEGVWQSFMLFAPTGQYRWQRRTKSTDLVTGLATEGALEDLGLIWGQIAPMQRVTRDSTSDTEINDGTFVVGRPVLTDDILDGRQVTRSNPGLGITIGMLA